MERAEDVIAHKRLLELAEDPANRPAFQVRLVQVKKHRKNTYNLFKLLLAYNLLMLLLA